MIQRIKTSNETANHLDIMQKKLSLSSKAAILRIALSLSLKEDENPDLNMVYETNQGFDLSLSTLFGDYELLFRTLIRGSYEYVISDEDYIKAIQVHIERGMRTLYAEFQVNNEINDLIDALLEV